MMRDYIKKGSEIGTGEGYEIVTGFNGSIVYTDSYEIDENGDGNKVGERYLTLSEIGNLMKEVDGLNHKVIWEEQE